MTSRRFCERISSAASCSSRTRGSYASAPSRGGCGTGGGDSQVASPGCSAADAGVSGVSAVLSICDMGSSFREDEWFRRCRFLFPVGRGEGRGEGRGPRQLAEARILRVASAYVVVRLIRI